MITDVVVIGAGHAGLSMSRCLSERGIDHVVIERGEIAHAWRHERWDSLRLLTPNWQSSLPGYPYRGSDPNGFMHATEVAAWIERYARFIAAPVRIATTVRSVTLDANGYRVITDQGAWRCSAVVLASGANAKPLVPPISSGVPASVTQLTSHTYRNPEQLVDRGVLVVGASATGVQLADEIRRSGRAVTLAIGEHVRMPRTYRGRDIQCWLHASGILDQRYDELEDLERARRVPSPQLIGSAERMLDLNTLTERGVRLAGRVVGFSDSKVQFSGSLHNHCTMADLKLGRLLRAIDAWIDASEARHGCAPAERFEPTRVPDRPALQIDLAAERIGTIIWATGCRPEWGYLQVPALDRKGRLQHDGGVAAVPGLYALGLALMRRRKSSFICGAEDDTRELSDHLHAYLRSWRHVRWAAPRCASSV